MLTTVFVRLITKGRTREVCFSKGSITYTLASQCKISFVVAVRMEYVESVSNEEDQEPSAIRRDLSTGRVVHVLSFPTNLHGESPVGGLPSPKMG